MNDSTNYLCADARPQALSSSFRDPAGFIFTRAGVIYRQINHSGEQHYSALMESGLYERLIARQLLVPHEEVESALAFSEDAVRVIQPTPIEYISYSYEWSFSQLKDAALLTLTVQRIALEHGMCLKDASAYNVQFTHGKPIFIDTLSFEPYVEGKPWVAYQQFCCHFLAPLAVASYCDYKLARILLQTIDGLSLPMVSKLLPNRSWLNYSLLAHIHLHAISQNRHANDASVESKSKMRKVSISKLAFQSMIESLRRAVERLQWRPGATEWGNYYSETNYSDEAMKRKEALVGEYLDLTDDSGLVIDLGSNDGRFSRLAAARGRIVVSMDYDELAVEKNYLKTQADGETHVLPLVQDLVDPSPAIGWECRERMSLFERGPLGVAMALALVHHLAISNNVPLQKVASFFAHMARYLIVEFIPKSDTQVAKLLATREDIFPDYTQKSFEQAFADHFDLICSETIVDSNRTLYLYKTIK